MKKYLIILLLVIPAISFGQNIKYSNRGGFVPNGNNSVVDSTDFVRGLTDSLNSKSNLWSDQTITGQKNFNKPVGLGNGIISYFGASLQLFHRENLSNIDITKSQVGVTFIPNNVSTIPYLNKYSVILLDTLNITSDTAKWRGFTVSLSNSGSKLGFVTGYYYTSSGNWTGAEIAYGNKRGRNTFNDSIGSTGVGLTYDQINAKFHVRSTHKSGNILLVEDSTGTKTIFHADSTNNIGIGGKSSTVAGVRIGRTVAIDSLTAGSTSDSIVTVKNGVLGKSINTNTTLSTFLPYIQTATYSTMLTHISANTTMTLPNGTTTPYRKYLVINDYEADGTGDGASSEYLYAKDKDGNPLLQKIARYTP